MNKNLRTICATLAISLLPIGATCYAKPVVEERYETIWVEAEKKVEDTKEKAEKTSASEHSIDDVLRFKSDKEKYDSNMGKEITLKIKVCKLKVSDDQSYIMSKDSSMKKAKCITNKAEASKCKEGDEVIVVGTLKEIKGNKILLENTKVIKVIDVNKKEYNKDKYKEKDKCEEKEEKNTKEDKCGNDRKSDKKEEKVEDKKTHSKDVSEKKDVKKTSSEKIEKDKKDEKTDSKIEAEKIEKAEKTSSDEKKEKVESKKTNSPKEEDSKENKVKE